MQEVGADWSGDHVRKLQTSAVGFLAGTQKSKRFSHSSHLRSIHHPAKFQLELAVFSWPATLENPVSRFPSLPPRLKFEEYPLQAEFKCDMVRIRVHASPFAKSLLGLTRPIAEDLLDR
jgi:hypothetical protein